MLILDGSMPAVPAPVSGVGGAVSSTALANRQSATAPVPVPAPARHVHVAHKGGRRTSFIPQVSGPAAPIDELVALSVNPSGCGEVAAAAQATVRTFLDGRLAPLTVPLPVLRDMQPDALGDVRRSVSYVGQPNYAGTVVAPTQWWAWRPAWCESLNERYHYLDLLIAHSVRQMATQCLRLEWRLSSGVRTHIPDAFLLVEADQGDQRLLVDVTTTQRLASPQTRAVFALTAATCRELGWRYEIRSEMPMQRQRNLSFLRCFARTPPHLLVHWRRQLAQISAPTTAHEVAIVLGDGDARRGLGPVWALLAAGDVHADLSRSLQPDTQLRHGRSGTVDEPWVMVS